MDVNPLPLKDREALQAALDLVEAMGFDRFADELGLRGPERNVFRTLVEFAQEHGAAEAFASLERGPQPEPAMPADCQQMLDVSVEMHLQGLKITTETLSARLDWAPAKVREIGAELRRRGMLA